MNVRVGSLVGVAVCSGVGAGLVAVKAGGDVVGISVGVFTLGDALHELVTNSSRQAMKAYTLAGR